MYWATETSVATALTVEYVICMGPYWSESRSSDESLMRPRILWLIAGLSCRGDRRDIIFFTGERIAGIVLGLWWFRPACAVLYRSPFGGSMAQPHDPRRAARLISVLLVGKPGFLRPAVPWARVGRTAGASRSAGASLAKPKCRGTA